MDRHCCKPHLLITCHTPRCYHTIFTGSLSMSIRYLLQDCEIQVYGYKGVGDPQCLWTFSMKDSVLALDTEVEGGRVSFGEVCAHSYSVCVAYGSVVCSKVWFVCVTRCDCTHNNVFSFRSSVSLHHWLMALCAYSPARALAQGNTPPQVMLTPTLRRAPSNVMRSSTSRRQRTGHSHSFCGWERAARLQSA
jgi:hypothetical protein